MKKVFLVDDEILVREGIRDRIHWEREGFAYCGDASDGELALPMIEQLAPDIVLTDIKMPFMDGLELSRIVKERMPETKIIVLSGHDEFHYAREALRIGIEEYCLKPIHAAELLKVLNHVSAKIDAKRLKLKELEALQKQAVRHEELSKEKLLLDLCSGTTSTAEAIQAAEALHLHLIASHYAAVIAHFERDGKPILPEGETAAAFTEMQSGFGRHLFTRSSKEYIWILKEASEEAVRKSACELEEGLKIFAAQLGCGVLVGIGQTKHRIQDISVSFSEAEQQKSYRQFLHRHPLAGLTRRQGEPVHDRNRVTNFLKYGDASKTEAFVEDYIQYVPEYNGDTMFYWHYLIIDMITASLQFIHEMNGDVQGMLKDLEAVEAGLLRSQGLREMRSCACELLMAVCRRRDQINDKYSDLLRKAKAYIDANFDKPDISLQSVAHYVNVSPSHFSTIFSQGVGQTFIDYLIRTRIQRAMELLRTTNAKSYEIAAMVGYSDPHYFNSLFKKMTGLTTKAFRNQ